MVYPYLDPKAYDNAQERKRIKREERIQTLKDAGEYDEKEFKALEVRDEIERNKRSFLDKMRAFYSGDDQDKKDRK